jgi:hypothetical protein
VERAYPGLQLVVIKHELMSSVDAHRRPSTRLASGLMLYYLLFSEMRLVMRRVQGDIDAKKS